MAESSSTSFSIRNIRNIVFDLGGVLLDIDYSKAVMAFKKLGVADDDHLLSAGSMGIFNRFDCGQISPSAFHAEMCALVGMPLSYEQVVGAWNAMLLDWDVARLELVETLRKRYRVYLLSNTNNIHFSCYNQRLEALTGGRSLNSLFDRAYYSFEYGLRKPSPEIFNLVVESSGLIPAETLFVDDTEENIMMASEVGMATRWIRPGEAALLSSILAGFLSEPVGRS